MGLISVISSSFRTTLCLCVIYCHLIFTNRPKINHHIKTLTSGGKKAFLRAEVTSFCRQYSLNAHTRKKHGKISQRFICFPTFIPKMWGIVTFLCKRLDCAASLILNNATYVNNSFTKFFFNPLSPKSDQHQISPCNINAL